MENAELVKRASFRRRHIALVALVPLLAALVFWLVESGHWLVVYNDGLEPLGEINLTAGEERWTVADLAPRESRRLKVRGTTASELLVDVVSWTPDPPTRVPFDTRNTSVTTLRLDASHGITATSEASVWHRLLNW